MSSKEERIAEDRISNHHRPPSSPSSSSPSSSSPTSFSSSSFSSSSPSLSSIPSSCRHHQRSSTCKASSLTSTATQVIVVLVIISLTLLVNPSLSCGPGRGGNRRRSPRKLTPLVFKQHIPNVSENTISASGFSEGRITREHSKFKELVPNYNPDIIFKDEEGTGADRLMTRRLKEKLNTLAISVMNQWPGVKLRVTEGWDQDNFHVDKSLHYEGRAVDITTSDRDRSKYGMLARLAVEAGFDWVYYESRYHIHCSVRVERRDDSRAGGCFDESSQVTTPTGQVAIGELQIGDEILALDKFGNPVFTPVILFLDRDVNASKLYHELILKSGKSISLTGSHLIFVLEYLTSDFNETLDSRREVFARQVIPGQYVTFVGHDGRIAFEKVVKVNIVEKRGVFAPLTSEGNLVVNHILASCYANINDQYLAHLAFSPLRTFSNFKESINHVFYSLAPKRKQTKHFVNHQNDHQGIHWYPKMLQYIANEVLPEGYND